MLYHAVRMPHGRPACDAEARPCATCLLTATPCAAPGAGAYPLLVCDHCASLHV